MTQTELQAPDKPAAKVVTSSVDDRGSCIKGAPIEIEWEILQFCHSVRFDVNTAQIRKLGDGNTLVE